MSYTERAVGAYSSTNTQPDPPIMHERITVTTLLYRHVQVVHLLIRGRACVVKTQEAVPARVSQ